MPWNLENGGGVALSGDDPPCEEYDDNGTDGDCQVAVDVTHADLAEDGDNAPKKADRRRTGPRS